MDNLSAKIFVNVILLQLCAYVSALANCPYSCRCDDNTLIVQCGEGQLDVLPIALNPSIKRLIIRSNKIKTIDSSIQFYAELSFLDLSSNHLVNIPHRTFVYQRKLQEIHLQHNKIGQISNRTFLGLLSLIVLNLRGNLISELHQGTFVSLPNIKELDLGENRIDSIDPKAFDGLTQLRILYLDDNALISLPDSLDFQAMINLGELYLGLNNLFSINSGAFQDLAGLTTLNLKGAGLYNLSHDSFKGLEALRILDLSDNRLPRIPTASLSRLQRLEVLYLGQNDFESVLEGAFTGLKQLNYLDITGSTHLKQVMNGAFVENTNLEILNLSSNKMLIEIQEGAFIGLPHLKEVYLKSNALATLAEGVFHGTNIKVLDVSENPMSCDCRIMWLRNLLIIRNNTGDQFREVFCEFPENLKGQKLTDLNPTLLGCSHPDPRRQALIGALLVGAVATVTTMALIFYRYRYKICQYMKGEVWNNSSLSRKERKYQKTFCDEDYTTSNHPHHSCDLYATFPNTYISHSSGHDHTGAISNCLNINSMNGAQRNFQQLQVHSIANSSLHSDKKLLKSKKGSNYSSSFVLHMKSCVNQHQPQKLNLYTKPHILQQTATVGDSCYSYADLPIAHNGISYGKMEAMQQQKQYHTNYHHTQSLFCVSTTQNDDCTNKNKITNVDHQTDSNYMYNNTHYSLPLEYNENSGTVEVGQNTAIHTPPSTPPALPMRNPPPAGKILFNKSSNGGFKQKSYLHKHDMPDKEQQMQIQQQHLQFQTHTTLNYH